MNSGLTRVTGGWWKEGSRRKEIAKRGAGASGGTLGGLYGTFPRLWTLVHPPKIEESWAMEGDRRLVGRAEEEGCCQKARGRGGGTVH